MKTALEIWNINLKEFSKGAPYSPLNLICKTHEDLIAYCMKEYAEQFINSAAESVHLREMTLEEMINGDLDGVENGYGIIFTINRESILKLKDQLK